MTSFGTAWIGRYSRRSLGIFAEQRAVRRVNARHDRRLIILQLGIIGQILGEMPDRPGNGGNAHQEHDGSGGEQETQEPHQQAHYRLSVPAHCAINAGAFLSANPGAEQ